MIGEVGRIGVVLPSNNVVLEPELYGCLPPGVTAHFSRMLATGSSPAALVAMAAEADRALGELAGAELDVYVYACLSTSLVTGHGWDERCAASMRARTGRPGWTAASATVAALKVVGARRISLVSPYPPAVHTRIPAYFARDALEVVSAASLDIADVHAVARCEPGRVAELARSTLVPAAEALCIVATDLATLDLVAPLEAALGVPVVTTNQALVWAALGSLAARDRLAGLSGPGELFRHL
jgi:maleate cis-trans isomerase